MARNTLQSTGVSNRLTSEKHSPRTQIARYNATSVKRWATMPMIVEIQRTRMESFYHRIRDFRETLKRRRGREYDAQGKRLDCEAVDYYSHSHHQRPATISHAMRTRHGCQCQPRTSTPTYGTYEVTIRMTDANGKQRDRITQLLAVDREDQRVLLGMPYLKAAEIIINTAEGTIHFGNGTHTIGYYPIAEQTLAMNMDGDSQSNQLLSDSYEDNQILVWETNLFQEPYFPLPDEEQPDSSPIAPLPKEIEDLDQSAFWDPSNSTAPCKGVEHRIQLTRKPLPRSPYHMSKKELEVLKAYIEDALAKDWIEPSQSLYSSPVLFVPKKDTEDLRLCVDYRALNKETVKDKYPLPLISEIMDRVQGMKYFTKLDLKDAYHRIPIAREDREKTAFGCSFGHFQYKVMPFGLTNAPATFQAYVNHSLQGLINTICIAFLDDILIYARTRAEMADRLRQVWQRLKAAELWVNRKKCVFFVEEVAFLGFILSGTGVTMDWSRVTAITEWPTPTSHKEVQVFLGFTNFYRRFITGYSRITAPLTDLLKGGIQGKKFGPFIWTDSEDAAFRKLKDAFKEEPVLRHFDPAKPIRVITDASAYAVAGTLRQPFDNHWHPIAFWSRKMTEPERNYPVHDQELLAIVESILHWRHYLEGATYPFEVFSDHANLQGFKTQQKINRRQARWILLLCQYDFIIKHLPGSVNPVDAQSRRPDYQKEAAPIRQLDYLTVLREKLAINEVILHQGPPLSNLATADGEGPLDSNESATSQKSESNQLIPRLALDDRSRVSASEANPEREENTHRIYTSESLVILLKLAQALDPFTRTKRSLIADKQSSTEWSIEKDLLTYKKRAYVPETQSVRNAIISMHHDEPTGGHYGVDRTRELLQRQYYWKSLTTDVEEYIKTCHTCQTTKPRRHRPYGELTALPLPNSPFEEITLDFVVGLPPSRWNNCVYDAILVIVDRFSKVARYIPTTKGVKAEEVGQLMYSEIFRQYGLPRGILSDRGAVFTSEWWNYFCKALGAKRRLTTAFHPQGDGQTERQNQSLKAYLKAFTNKEHNNWVERLVLAEFTYNSTKHSLLGCAPFEILYGHTPRNIMDLALTTQAPRTMQDRFHYIQSLKRRLTENYDSIKASEAKFYNKKHTPMSFKEGDEVIINTENINLRLPSKKLCPRYIGPFRVLKAIGTQAYRIALPEEYNFHNVFNVSKLERYHPRDNKKPEIPDKIFSDLSTNDWTPEKILDVRKHCGNLEYRIRWKDKLYSEDSWESERITWGYPDLLDSYNRSKAQRTRCNAWQPLL